MLSGLTHCIAQVRLPFPSFSPPFIIPAAAPSTVRNHPLQCAHGRAAVRPPRLDGARLLPFLSRSRSSRLRILPPSLRRDLAARCLGLLLLCGRSSVPDHASSTDVRTNPGASSASPTAGVASSASRPTASSASPGAELRALLCTPPRSPSSTWGCHCRPPSSKRGRRFRPGPGRGVANSALFAAARGRRRGRRPLRRAAVTAVSGQSPAARGGGGLVGEGGEVKRSSGLCKRA
jgi:hypothetical protein